MNFLADESIDRQIVVLLREKTLVRLLPPYHLDSKIIPPKRVCQAPPSNIPPLQDMVTQLFKMPCYS